MSKVWLVTGSSRGLGRALAEAVLAAGDRLVASARDPRDLDFLASSDRLRTVALDVTNSDATPAVANTSGEGGPGTLKAIEGSVVVSAAATIDSTYQLVRVASNCKVKKIFLETATQAAGSTPISSAARR